MVSRVPWLHLPLIHELVHCNVAYLQLELVTVVSSLKGNFEPTKGAFTRLIPLFGCVIDVLLVHIIFVSPVDFFDSAFNMYYYPGSNRLCIHLFTLIMVMEKSP